jgi:hypothetical protein
LAELLQILINVIRETSKFIFHSFPIMIFTKHTYVVKLSKSAFSKLEKKTFDRKMRFFIKVNQQMLLSIKLTREHFTKNMEEMCTICVWHGYITRRGQHKQGWSEPGARGKIAPSDVGPIRIREGVNYAHHITTSSPSPGFLDLPTALQVGAGAVTAIGY